MEKDTLIYLTETFYNLRHSLLPAYCGCRTAPEFKYPYAQF